MLGDEPAVDVACFEDEGCSEEELIVLNAVVANCWSVVADK